ncbi:ribonuclease R [Alicyclobacillus suci]|uniref:ribonuclease R n=1 Tax=Alicyclobacillus suci TaxID=2816080 RepID=UPI001A8D2850|nr:ribonuclease R [Alicyclobacillus suci]
MQREELLEYMESDIYKPLTVQELSEVLDQTSASEFRDLVKLLTQLEDEGAVVRTKHNRYALPDTAGLVVGKLQMKARGFGFVISERDGEPDVYIPATEMNGAMSGDKVMAKVQNEGRGGAHREGTILRVVERANERIVGKITIYAHHAFVNPIDKRFTQDIFIPKEEIRDAHDGYIVVVELTSFPSATHGPVGRIVEVLGHPDEPGVDILSVVRKYGLPEEFPEKVLRATEAIPLEIAADELKNRRDLRDEPMVTIDSESAKDLDDAVHVKLLENGNYLLGVHIADVGYYVKQGGAIDQEAFRRGTSVYLVDRVIPMLPPRLSNNICSLNPQVDRLAFSCQMEIDAEGNVVNHDIFPSVIKTTARMTYNNVRKILEDNDEALIEEYKELVPMFRHMEQLALILRQKRMRRGAVDFDFEEIYVKVNDLGEPIDIIPRQRSIAERLIEEFMLAANETVAEHFHWLGVPFVYRVHDEPDADKMITLNAFLHNFGYHLKGAGGSKVHPRALQEVLNEVEGSREARMIATVMLRSMQQAKYKPECTGHFGLAAEYYTHFTSPIRRYPDLTIHRIMREVLAGPLSPEREAELRQFVEDASRQSSERERLAQDAEREVDQLKMVEYMQAHLDEEFDGIISSVTQFGIFVQLDNGVEGLIHISALDDDYYVFNERQMALIGERNRRVFRLGDPVRIVVTSASKEELQINFGLVEHRREATFVAEQGGGGAIIYDEDLSPSERRESILRRESRSSAAPKGTKSAIRSGGLKGRSRRDKLAGRTVEGGYGRSGRTRDAELPVDMPYDEWDADFPDPREAREQAQAEREGRREGHRDAHRAADSGRRSTTGARRGERSGRSDRDTRRDAPSRYADREDSAENGVRRSADGRTGGYRTWAARGGESTGGDRRRSGRGGGAADDRTGAGQGDGHKPRKKHRGSVKTGAKMAARKSGGRGVTSGGGRSTGKKRKSR